jgi:hypothetical protein
MNKKILLGLISVVITLAAIFTFYWLGKKEEAKVKENEVVINKDFDKENNFISMKFGNEEFTKEGKVELKETKNEKLIVKNTELSKIKEKYKIDVEVYETGKTAINGELKNYIIIFKNNGNKEYKETLNFPCNYTLTIYENDEFLEGKKGCKKGKDEELLIPAKSYKYLVFSKMIQTEAKELKLYFESPFGIYETVQEITTKKQ